MNKAFRYYNQNRFEIIVVIILIVIGLIILHFINYRITKENQEEYEQQKNNTNIIQNAENTRLYSITTGETKENAKITTGVIQKFIEYCNNRDISKAYDMLSENCKKELFPTETDFINLYWQSKFQTEKTVRVENWRNSTYKVYLSESMLSTGKKSTSEIQDYITIVTENANSRLNINGFIGKTNLQKSATNNNVTINVTDKSTYMDYEIYTFRIKNNGSADILLDDCKKTDTIYITDSNGTRHVAYMHELLPELLNIKSKQEMEVKIKFTNAYISNRSFSTITFSNIIMQNGKTVSLDIEL